MVVGENDGDSCAGGMESSELGLAGRQSKLPEHLLKVARARYREFLDIIEHKNPTAIPGHCDISHQQERRGGL